MYSQIFDSETLMKREFTHAILVLFATENFSYYDNVWYGCASQEKHARNFHEFNF